MRFISSFSKAEFRYIPTLGGVESAISWSSCSLTWFIGMSQTSSNTLGSNPRSKDEDVEWLSDPIFARDQQISDSFDYPCRLWLRLVLVSLGYVE
ncbi:hypothetical protein Tco_1269764 [Tanacetum coccineum]